MWAAQRFLLYAAALLWATDCGICAGGADDTLLPAEFVAAGISHHFGMYGTCVALVTRTQRVPAELAEALREATLSVSPSPSTDTRTYYWALRDGDVYLSLHERDGIKLERTVLSRQVVAVRHEEYRKWELYVSAVDRGQTVLSLGTRAPAVDYAPQGLPLTHMQYDPRYFAYFHGDRFLADVLRDPDTNAHPVTRERLFGGDCACVATGHSPGSSQFLWFDLDHGFIMRKAETFVRVGGEERVVERITIPELTGADGQWLPKKVEVELTFRREDGAALGTALTTVLVEHVAFGVPIAPSIFDLSFPPGTLISDYFDNQEYEVQWAVPDAGASKDVSERPTDRSTGQHGQ